MEHYLLLFGFLFIGVLLYSAYVVAEKLLSDSRKTWKSIIIQSSLAVITIAVGALVLALCIDNPVILAVAGIVAGLLCSYWVAKLMKVKGR